MRPPAPSAARGPALAACALLALAATAPAQVAPPDPPALPRSDQDPFLDRDADLTASYRLVERYKAGNRGQGLEQFQVAFRETIRTTVDQPRGAPTREERTSQARFTERPAQVTGDGRTVQARVRRFESASTRPDALEGARSPAFLENLTYFERAEAPAASRVVLLTPDRPFYDHEFRFAIGVAPDMPALSGLLPERPVRLLDTWTAPADALRALLGLPVGGSDIQARLVEVRPLPAPEGGAPDRLAVIELAGTALTPLGETRVNARLEFRFPADAPAEAPVGAGARPTRTRAGQLLGQVGPNDGIKPPPLGGITEVRLAQETTVELPEQPRQTVRRELVAQRRWPGEGATLELPETPPAATPANTWLTYLDPEGLFRLSHPQDFEVGTDGDPDRLVLGVNRPEGRELVVLNLRRGSQPKPDASFQDLFDYFRDQGWGVQPLPPSRLAAEGWGQVEAHRVEAVLTSARAAAGGAPGRLYINGYLLLFPTNNALTAYAVTPREQAAEFRTQVEAILKTFRLGNLAPTPAPTGP